MAKHDNHTAEVEAFNAWIRTLGDNLYKAVDTTAGQHWQPIQMTHWPAPKSSAVESAHGRRRSATKA